MSIYHPSDQKAQSPPIISVCLSVSPCLRVSVYQSCVHLPSFYLLSVCISACPSICLSVTLVDTTRHCDKFCLTLSDQNYENKSKNRFLDSMVCRRFMSKLQINTSTRETTTERTTTRTGKEREQNI